MSFEGECSKSISPPPGTTKAIEVTISSEDTAGKINTATTTTSSQAVEATPVAHESTFLPANKSSKASENTSNSQGVRREKLSQSTMEAQTNVPEEATPSEAFEDELDIIFRSNGQEYQLIIKHREFKTSNKSIDRTPKLEVAKALRSRPPVPLPPGKPVVERSRVMSTSDQSEIICHQCGEKGHKRVECRNPVKIFCWDCGKLDVKTIYCCRKRSENDQEKHQQ